MPWALPEGAVLGLFVEPPVAGRVKPEVAGLIGPDRAADLHEAILFDLIETWGSDRVLAPGGRRVLVYDPPDAGPWFDVRVPESFALQPQAPGDPGRRREAFFRGEFEDGARSVVLIGTDAPALDPSVVVSAFLCLEGRDVVLGPSAGGGYYLIGCRANVPPIFEGVDWGTADVLSQTIDRLDHTGLSLSVLTPCYDVVTPDDIRTLSGHLRALRRAGVDPGLPRTEALLHGPG